MDWIRFSAGRRKIRNDPPAWGVGEGFSGIQLNFERASLDAVDLKEAKRKGANSISGGLKGATLREANLKVPKYLTRGQLCSATFNSETVFPDGSTGHMRGGDGRRRSEGQIEKAIRPRWEERQTELLKENPEGGGGGRGLRTIGHHFQRGDAVLE